MLGETINSRYRIDAELGQGGMGTVYRAHDLSLQRDVALKLLSNSKLGSEGRQRMLVEAQTVAKLQHPNIVTVFDVGEHDKMPYIVMELVAGNTLDQANLNNIDAVIDLTKQICEALEHAHFNDVIHRDLKPENIIIQPNGVIKLMDFGLARSMTTRLTEEGAIMGTIFYMAPEQALGRDIDRRADLYALGVVVYELLTGRLPFEGDHPVAIITQHVNAPVTPPRARREDVPRYLSDLIVQLMSKHPDDRPATAAEVIAALDRGEKQAAPDSTGSLRDSDVLQRIVRGRMVGREKETDQARQVWRQAMTGAGQTLLVTGEPGIGKSRLIREMMTEAEFSRGRALFGASYAEGGASYGLFAQIIREALLSDSQPDLPEFVIADLLVLAPELRPYFPDVPENAALGPAQEQQRIFQSFVAFCKALSAEAPLLLVLDDVHWSDGGTLKLWRHLGRNLAGLPVLVLATYREVELSGAPALQEVLAEVQRESTTHRVKLTRLDRGQTKDLLQTLFADDITDEFLDLIYTETEGNPFFVEEVCKALVESGKLYYEDGEWHRPDVNDIDIPQSVVITIQSRVDKLPKEHQDVLLLAAALGREFDFDALLASSGLEEEALIDILEKVEQNQLIEEVRSARMITFAFVHALIPTALLESVSSLRLRRLHGQIAEVLESLRPDDKETLVYHYIASGDIEKGLEASLAAAARAKQSYSPDDAKLFLDYARECAEALDDSDTLSLVYEELGRAYSITGPYSQAIEYYQQAISYTDSEIRRKVLQVGIGAIYVHIGNERAKDILEGLIDGLEPATHAADLARALYSLGRVYHLKAQYSKAIEYYQRAYNLVEPLGDLVTLSFIYPLLSGAYQHLTQFEESIRWAQAGIDLGEKNNLPRAVAAGYEFMGEDYAMMGRWQQALDAAEQDYTIGEKISDTSRLAWASFIRGMAYDGVGRLHLATQTWHSSVEIAKQLGDSRLISLASSQWSLSEISMGNFSKAQALLQESRQIAEGLVERQLHFFCDMGQGYLYLHQDKNKEALEMFLQGQDRIADTELMSARMYLAPWLAFAYLFTNDIDNGIQAAQTGFEVAKNAQALHYQGIGQVALSWGNTLKQDWEAAEISFASAIKILADSNTQYYLGLAYYWRGRMWQDRGEISKAKDDLTEALAIFQECQAAPFKNKAQAELAKLG